MLNLKKRQFVKFLIFAAQNGYVSPGVEKKCESDASKILQKKVKMFTDVAL